MIQESTDFYAKAQILKVTAKTETSDSDRGARRYVAQYLAANRKFVHD